MEEKQLFKTYQKSLVRLANMPYGRKYLRLREDILKDKEIVAVLPNAVIAKERQGVYRGHFYTGYPVFALRVGLALSSLELAKERFRIPKDFSALLHYAGLDVNPFAYPLIHHATYDADSGGDGSVYKDDSTTWSTVHDATDGVATVTGTNAAQTWVRRASGGGNFLISRGFWPADTSGIGASTNIVSASLNLYVTAKEDDDNDGNDFISVVGNTQASNTALATADYDALDTTEWIDSGERKDIGSISTSAYLTLNFNGTGIGNVSKTGYTKSATREGHDLLNDPITFGTDVGNRADVTPADSASNKPYYDVTFGISGGGDYAYFM